MRQINTQPPLPERPSDGHKGTFGRVLIIAGSRGMSGAACLAGKAALRGGAGLVYVAVPEGILPIVAGYEPSYLTVPLAEDDAGRIDAAALATVLREAKKMDAVAVGPGLGQSAGLRLLAIELYRILETPLLIDADGLNLLAKSTDSLGEHVGPRVMTPHVGEFSRLIGFGIDTIESDRESLAASFAARHGITLVLKGPGTIITDGERIALNATGNSGLASGGTGDVLTGIIVSLLAQGMSPFDAAQLGAWIHGAAGDLAAGALSERGMIASDLVDFIPSAWLNLEREQLG